MIGKTWQIFKSCFFIAGITICLLILIFEIKGLPENIKLGIRQKLDNQHLQYQFGDIQVGPINGLKISDTLITDKGFKNIPLYTAEEIKLDFHQNNSLNGNFKPKSLSLTNGDFKIPFLIDDNQRLFELSSCNLKVLFPDESRVVIENLSGKTKYSQLKISGEVYNLPKKEKKASESQFNLPDTIRLNELIPLNVKRQLFQFRDAISDLGISSSIHMDAHCKIDATHPEKSVIDLKLFIPSFLIHGNAIRQLSATLTLTNSSIIVKSFKLEADNNETINGELQFDINSKIIQGNIYGRFFPTRYLKTIVPEYTNAIDFITFKNSPPELKIIIDPSPINDIEKLSIRGTAKITDFAIQGFNIDLLEGDFFTKGFSVSAPKMQVHSPDINGLAGVSYSTSDNKIHVTGDCFGDPRHIAHFIFSATARRNYLNVWSRFAWGNAARPHWKGYFNYDLNDHSMIFDGNFEANGATINGIKTQSLKAGIYMNYPEHILINDLKVEATNGYARADLGFRDVDTECHMDYSFYSTLPTGNVIELINPAWKQINEIFRIEGENYIRAAGSFPISDPLSVRSEAYLEVEKAQYNGIDINDAILTLNLRKKQLIIASQKAKLYSGDFHLYYQEDLETRNQAIKISGDQIDLAGVISDTQKQALTSASGKIDFGIDISLKSENGHVKSILGNGKIHISEGLFWEIPFLSQFFNTIENVLPFSSATKIKAVSAQLSFYDKSIQIDRFFTDGSLLALSGDGMYNWGDQSYNFNINTHYLKSILVLPRPFNVDILKEVFSPLSVLAKAQVKGKGNEWKWKIDVMKNIGNSIKNIPSKLLSPFKKFFD